MSSNLIYSHHKLWILWKWFQNINIMVRNGAAIQIFRFFIIFQLCRVCAPTQFEHKLYKSSTNQHELPRLRSWCRFFIFPIWRNQPHLPLQNVLNIYTQLRKMRHSNIKADFLNLRLNLYYPFKALLIYHLFLYLQLKENLILFF